MTTPTVGLKPRIAIPNASAYASLSGKSPRGTGIEPPTRRYFAASPSLMPRYIEIYRRALADELRLTEEVQGAFSSVRIHELEQELTGLIDDCMCLKRMRTLLPLDPITLDAAPFIALERHTHTLQQKIRTMAIITQLHFLRDELNPSISQKELLKCLFKAKAHINCLRSKKHPKLIDLENKMLFENLLYVIRDRFIGLSIGETNLEIYVNFIEDENLHLMNLDGLVAKLSVLIDLVKDPRFEIAVAEKISVESLISLRMSMPAK
jgi:hypothetical protein